MNGPELEAQFLSLSPGKKIVVGSILGAGGAVACVMLWERGWIVWAAVLAALFGPTLASIGLHERARERAVDAEVARARAEWR